MATPIHYLSQLVDRPVLDHYGEPVGRIGDFVVRLSGAYPPVTGVIVTLGRVDRSRGRRATFMPWIQVAEITTRGLALASTRLDLQRFRRRPGELLVKADLLDQQVIDLGGRKLVRVNDIQLVAAGPGGLDFRLAGIDVGARGLFRRLDLDRFVSWVGTRTPFRVDDRVIPWEGVEPVDIADLPAEAYDGVAGSSRGVRLTYERLATLHPADVAEVVSQLAAPDRAAVLESLDSEMAAETLGELDPEMQGDVLEYLPTETAVDILSELPPDEAADALAEVSEERAAELLSGLDADDAQSVRELMAYPEDAAGGMMSNHYVAIEAHLTAERTIETLRQLRPPPEEIYYVYVVDDDGMLRGVLSLRDLIVSPPDTPLTELIREDTEVVRVPADMPRDEVIQVFDKYNLLAVPVTDESGRLVGVVTVDDALGAALPEERPWLSRVRL
jgi:magnesium transporter